MITWTKKKYRIQFPGLIPLFNPFVIGVWESILKKIFPRYLADEFGLGTTCLEQSIKVMRRIPRAYPFGRVSDDFPCICRRVHYCIQGVLDT